MAVAGATLPKWWPSEAARSCTPLGFLSQEAVGEQAVPPAQLCHAPSFWNCSISEPFRGKGHRGMMHLWCHDGGHDANSAPADGTHCFCSPHTAPKIHLCLCRSTAGNRKSSQLCFLCSFVNLKHARRPVLFKGTARAVPVMEAEDLHLQLQGNCTGSKVRKERICFLFE